MKSAVKVPAKKTNNHGESFGKSILENNMEMEAAMELALHADRSGKGHPKGMCTLCKSWYKSLGKCVWFAQSI